MTLVIVVAAIGALVLLAAILALSRSRFADESERFRYVSDLTSKWSRQQQMQTQAPPSADSSLAGSDGGDAAGETSIDLRGVEPGARRS